MIGISAVSYYLPQNILSTNDLEREISKNFPVEKGFLERLTGVKNRYISSEDQYNSTLAAFACKRLFEENNIDKHNIDLLIFASAGQDILEPATAHIIQKIIGTSCPVIDVTNACNSFLNALEIAHSFVSLGRYKNILIATGEVPSMSAKFKINDKNDFKLSLPGYVFGDAGTAVLVNSEASIGQLKESYFFSDSSNWDCAMFPGGGSRYLDNKNSYFFSGDGSILAKSFKIHTKEKFNYFLNKNNLRVSEIDHFFIHQVTLNYLERLAIELNIPLEKIELTIQEYGNVAAASLPLAFSLRKERGEFKKGDKSLLIGLAGGMSIGLYLLEH